APLTGVIADGWKYIDLPEPELYNLEDDPREEHNAVGPDSQRATSMLQRLATWNGGAAAGRAAPHIGLVDPDAEARLRALGYTAPQSPPPASKRFTVADDPKRLVDLERRYESAITIT